MQTIQNFIALLAHRAFASIHRFTCLSCPHASVSCHVNRKILNTLKNFVLFSFVCNISEYPISCGTNLNLIF